MTRDATRRSTLDELLRTQPALWRGQLPGGGPGSNPGGSPDGGTVTGQPGSWPRSVTIATGFAALDAALPLGGWEAGSLTDIMLRHEGMGEFSLLLPALRSLTAGQGRWVALVSPPHQPYAPALANAGLRLDRLLVIEAGEHTLWATEQALRSGTFGAVLAWPPSAGSRSAGLRPAGLRPAGLRPAGLRPAAHAHRRLQLAAATGQTWAVLYRPYTCATEHSPAALRLVLEPTPSGHLPGHLQVQIIKARKGQPRSLTLDWQEFDQPQGALWPGRSSACQAIRPAR